MRNDAAKQAAVRGSLRTAASLDALCEAAEACGLGELLDGPASLVLEAVAWDAHAAAPVVHHLADTGMADTVRDLLVGPDFVRRFRRRGRTAGVAWLVDTLRGFFEAELAATRPSAEGTLHPEASPSSVRAWAADHGVSDLLALPVGVLLDRLSGRAADHLERFPASGCVADVFAAPTAGVGVRGADWPPLPFSVKLATTDWLREEADGVVPDHGVPVGSGPPLPDAVARFEQALVAARSRLLAHTAPRAPLPPDAPALVGAWTDRASDVVQLHGPPGALACRPGGTVAVSMLLDAHQPDRSARCACGGDASRCRYTLWSVDSLLGALAARTPEVVKGLGERLGVPRWSRELDVLADLLGDPDHRAPKDGTPAWLVSADARGELTLSAVWVRPFRRKAGVRVFPGRTSPTDAADGAVFDQLRLLPELAGGEPGARRAVVLRALESLVGHPEVYLSLDGPGAVRRATVQEAEVGLFLGLGDGPDTLALSVALNGRPWPRDQVRFDVLGRCAGDRTAWIDDGVHVARIPEAARRLAQLVLDRGPTYPASALGTLVDRLPTFEEALPVHIDGALVGEPVSPRPRLQVQLAWRTPPTGPEVLRLRLRVCPLPRARPRRPGLGPSRALGRHHGVPVHCYRDRAEERALAAEVLHQLGLGVPKEADARWEWPVVAPEPALGVVAAVDALVQAQSGVDVVWDGPRPGVRTVDSADGLTVSVRPAGKRGWFRLDGALQIDAVEMALADLLDQARRGRRHVRVAPGQWVGLSDALFARLSELADVSRGAEVPGFSGGPVEGLVDLGAHLDADARWTRLRERVHAANHATIAPPEGLRCTLRPYQRRGFEWMVRLTAWGAGGVLADDMGLGKTVQALALLVHRQTSGPALVVAPSSLLFNWSDEAARFAPGLTVRTYRGARRSRWLADLGPGHVLLTTYDTLARDAQVLAGISFGTLILDEAQAIKNARTHRARAVFGLQAEARMALSGTPIENRLEELWSLLEAVCPGLLGPRPAFVEDFVQPIEGQGDTERQAALARIIQPFVLRRLKADVAPELPARVTIVRRITARPDHASHYARERERAVAETRQLLASEAEGAHMRVLAWITRLRMLACHPGLVDPGWTGGSAKLDHALELVDELVQGDHSVLVFSQFTRHLDRVRDGLDALGVSWVRLDGRTSPSGRAKAVARFQAGDARVFLLSLKAGGVGLNLTAADHVLLLDPWWNPAAEDQAADRAHRIGQDQPVTITRLVTAGTLEDDILALQDDKRALVAATLSGTGTAGRLDGAELARLIEGSDALRARPDDGIPF